jgi:hypothetical protein
MPRDPYETLPIEGFSDTVFTCHRTLFVASVEAPPSFAAGRLAMGSWLGFAPMFPVACSIWHERSRFSRSTGLSARWTAFLALSAGGNGARAAEARIAVEPPALPAAITEGIPHA